MATHGVHSEWVYNLLLTSRIRTSLGCDSKCHCSQRAATDTTFAHLSRGSQTALRAVVPTPTSKRYSAFENQCVEFLLAAALTMTPF